jgi:hypothetical protein
MGGLESARSAEQLRLTASTGGFVKLKERVAVNAARPWVKSGDLILVRPEIILVRPEIVKPV